MIDETFDYPDYLSAKKLIDDASLNPKVWAELLNILQTRQSDSQSVRILEIGAGIGTMIERLLQSGLLLNCDYTTLELEPGFDVVARQRLENWCRRHDGRLSLESDGTWRVAQGNSRVNILWTCSDAMNLSRYFQDGAFDLMIGHAVVDLLPVPLCMPAMLECLADSGAFYFSLNYAGVTSFHPPHPTDQAISEAYNADMDSRFPALDWKPSQTGILLGPWLSGQGHTILAEGSSNWNLTSATGSALPANRFIGNILDTIAKALNGMPGLDNWLQGRYEQLQRGELTLHAGNHDYLGIISKKK